MTAAVPHPAAGQGDRDDDVDVLTVTITADTSRFRAAIQESIAQLARLYTVAMPIYLARQRRRSRIVTRRKQRRSW